MLKTFAFYFSRDGLYQKPCQNSCFPDITCENLVLSIFLKSCEVVILKFVSQQKNYGFSEKQKWDSNILAT